MLLALSCHPLQFSVGALEGGALGHVACGETEFEPLHALLGGAMSEGLWSGIAASLLLKVVVAYLLGTVDGFLKVAVFE